MNERVSAALSVGFKIVLYIAFIILTIVGLQHAGWDGLTMEFIGLAGIIGVLWWYNRNNQ